MATERDDWNTPAAVARTALDATLDKLVLDGDKPTHAGRLAPTIEDFERVHAAMMLVDPPLLAELGLTNRKRKRARCKARRRARFIRRQRAQLAYKKLSSVLSASETRALAGFERQLDQLDAQISRIR